MHFVRRHLELHRRVAGQWQLFPADPTLFRRAGKYPMKDHPRWATPESEKSIVTGGGPLPSHRRDPHII